MQNPENRIDGPKIKKGKKMAKSKLAARNNDEYVKIFGAAHGETDTRMAKGRLSPNHFEFDEIVYDFSNRGSGMLLAIIDRFSEIVKSPAPSAEQIDEIGIFLAARDRQTGKPPKADYRKTARVYRGHARKHLGLGRAKSCPCSEIAPEFQARIEKAEFKNLCPRWENKAAADAAAAEKVKAATEEKAAKETA